jgi:putative flippase GtrA
MTMSCQSPVPLWPRWGRFALVGVLGFMLQLSVLDWLTRHAHWHWLAATAVAVELAVVHNFLWHERWTWRGRAGGRRGHFAKFQLANGAASLAGNAALMALFSGALGWPPAFANICAVALMAAANFVAADRWVFRGSTKSCRIAILCLVSASAAGRAAAQEPATLAAWERYVTATEARLERSRMASRSAAWSPMPPAGETIGVPAGTISDWRGSVFIRGVTLDRLLRRLQDPGTPPPQEDVVSSRVISRDDDTVRVAIRLVRRAIVTVTYDTEHTMRFHRWRPGLATARSEATRIEEVGGADHGFLWRLHSYWRYEEVDGGVLVELESLTLSRDVPSLVRPIAAPLMTRIARESMARTLAALQPHIDADQAKDAREGRITASTPPLASVPDAQTPAVATTSGDGIGVPCARTRS